MENSIFLSASVPDPKRAPEFAESSNTVAITSAVRALVHVTLGRRPLVWGGHPAITPMIKVVAEEMGVDYGKWVKLYQSLYFREEFPEDNEAFNNVIYTDSIANSREKSLHHLREQMFSENSFKAAIFIGGMAGIVDEYKFFRHLQPNKTIIPVASTGGATLTIAQEMNLPLDCDLYNELDYVRLFHNKLGVSVREERFESIEAQPKDIEERYWNPD